MIASLLNAILGGAVGSVVGQIAKIKGCHAVGIAGGTEKCRFVTGDLGFDACIDHRAPDFAEQLQTACPKGIDVYFESVGGAVQQTVWPACSLALSRAASRSGVRLRQQGLLARRRIGDRRPAVAIAWSPANIQAIEPCAARCHLGSILL